MNSENRAWTKEIWRLLREHQGKTKHDGVKVVPLPSVRGTEE